MMTGLFLIVSLTLATLLVSQKKQFEFQMKSQLTKYQQRESEFQKLRESHWQLDSKNQQLVSLHQELKLDLEREQALVLRLNQELAKEKGSVQERAKALEWDLQ
jgi:hypothetical protein